MKVVSGVGREEGETSSALRVDEAIEGSGLVCLIIQLKEQKALEFHLLDNSHCGLAGDNALVFPAIVRCLPYCSGTHTSTDIGEFVSHAMSVQNKNIVNPQQFHSRQSSKEELSKRYKLT